MTNHIRQPAGQPTGGEFAKKARASADVSLQTEPKRYQLLNGPVGPDNSRVQAMAELAEEMRAGQPHWQEHFPETIRSRWLHDIDPEDYWEDTVGPAMRAIEDGRTEDAMWYFNQLEAMNEREKELSQSGYTPPGRGRYTTLENGDKERVGPRHNPDATPQEVAKELEDELVKAQKSGYLVDGDIKVEPSDDGIITVRYAPDRTLLYRSGISPTGTPEGAAYSEYGDKINYRLYTITDSFTRSVHGEDGLHGPHPHIEINSEEEDFDEQVMADLNGLMHRDMIREQG